MAATTVTSGYKTTTTFFPLSLPTPPPPSQKIFPVYKQLIFSNCRTQISSRSVLIGTFSPSSVSSPESSIVEDDEAAEESETSSVDEIPSSSGPAPSLTGCKACGREEIERGCNGEGRIQGGIATVPGFGWWPIKAYRPCPAYVASGGRYRRTGQSMDEVVSGRGLRDASGGTTNGVQSRKKNEGPRRSKR